MRITNKVDRITENKIILTLRNPVPRTTLYVLQQQEVAR